MSLYCLCIGKVDGAPNRVCAKEPWKDDFPPLSLPKRMLVIKTGTRQVILTTPATTEPPTHTEYREHYPRVDVFRCEHCGTIVAQD